MKPFQASLINAGILVVLGLWGYLESGRSSWTPLVPVASGALLLVLNPGLKRGNKIVAHIVVVFTLLIFVLLFRPLVAALKGADTAALLRVLVMMLSTLLALVIFIRSFIRARKEREL